MTYTTKATRIGSVYGCRVFRDGVLIVEGRCSQRNQIGATFRDLLRTIDKSGGDAFTSAARRPLEATVRHHGVSMGLKIVHDGSMPGDVQENCCMCRTNTRWWWGTGKRNVALCPECAKTTKASELPTKEEWCSKERKLNQTRHASLSVGDA